MNGINTNSYNVYNPYKQNGQNKTGPSTNAVANNFSGMEQTPVVSTAKDKATDNGPAKLMMGIPTTPEGWVKFLPILGGTILSAILVTKGANRACAGKLGESALHKMGGWVDKWANKLIPTSISDKATNIKTSIAGFLGRSKTLTAIKNAYKTGVEPKWGFVKKQMRGLAGNAWDEVMAVTEMPLSKLNKLGFGDKLLGVDIAALKKATNGVDGFENIDNLDFKTISSKLKKLDETAKTPEIKGAIQQLDNIEKDSKGLIEDFNSQLAQVIRNNPSSLDELSKVEMRRGGFIPGWNNTNKKIDLVRATNKSMILNGQGATTLAGRSAQKLSLGMAEAIGGGVLGGSAIGIAANSFFIAGSLNNAANAPKDEKTKTFMEDFWGNLIGGYLMMFPATRFMFHTLGLSKVTHGMTGIGKYALKPVEWITKPFTIGLGPRKPNPSAGRKAWDWTKGGIGAVSRFSLFMFGIIPPITHSFMRASDAVFGKPTKSMLDEGKEEETAKTDSQLQTPQQSQFVQQKNPFQMQSSKQQATISNAGSRYPQQGVNKPQTVNNNSVKTSETPLASQILNNQKSAVPATPTNMATSSNKKDSYSYIPSSTPSIGAKNLSTQGQKDGKTGDPEIDKIITNSDEVAANAEKLLEELN